MQLLLSGTISKEYLTVGQTCTVHDPEYGGPVLSKCIEFIPPSSFWHKGDKCFVTEIFNFNSNAKCPINQEAPACVN